ncbi:MAG: recombinase family protein [Bacteroidales bacterium]|nr:recombinase family protein [Bacteroidales bacterium]
MAKTGYLFLAKGYKAREEDIAWMKEFGCESIVIEEGVQERLRPQWRRLLTLLKKNDVIVLTRLSNAVRGIRELGAFLDLCRVYKIRIVSIHDRIDTGNELFPETTAGEVIDTISRISEESTKVRRSEGRIVRNLKSERKERAKSALRTDREKMIVNMYKSGHAVDDIWKVSGYKSRTTIFRVLKRNGVELNRRPSPAGTDTTDQE